MLRRPLTRNPHHDDLLHDPLTTLVHKFWPASDGMPPDIQKCVTPEYRFTGLPHMAACLGLSAEPTGRRDVYPASALEGQHPSTFLQWGWLMRPNRQVLFEIGDVTSVVSLHLLKTLAGDKANPWHLDDIIIDTGMAETYQICAEDPAYAGLRCTLLSGIAAAVSALNADDWRGAQQGFHAMVGQVKRTLDDIADQHHADHANGMRDIRPIPAIRP